MKLKNLVFAGLCTAIISCTSNSSQEKGITQQEGSDSVAASSTPQISDVADSGGVQLPSGPSSDQKFELRIFSSVEGSGGFGYDIFADGKPYIHQPHIPAIAGNRGFATEEAARKAGEFILTKIRKNIMPPSVTKEELDSLGVL